MTARPHAQPALSEPGEAAARALARQVIALLKPALEEVDRKLDSLIEKIAAQNELLARWDAGSIDDLLARLRHQGAARPRAMERPPGREHASHARSNERQRDPRRGG